MTVEMVRIKGDFTWQKLVGIGALWLSPSFRSWPWQRVPAAGARREPASNGGGGQVAGTPRLKVALITHAEAGDTFWDIVRKGAEEAAAKDNVEILYTNDSEAGRQAQLVQQAIDQKVDGIAVTIANPGAMKDVMKKAADAGIPLVSFNAGGDVSAQLGAFTHFGSNETLAGEAVGTKLAAEGYKHPICVIMAQGQVQLEARCAGVKAKVPGTEILYVDGKDMTSVQSTATAKLQASKDADVIVGLGAPYTVTLLKAVTDANSSIKVASFDLNPALAQAINDGKSSVHGGSAAVLAGIPGSGCRVADQARRLQSRRRPVRPDRARHRGQVQHL